MEELMNGLSHLERVVLTMTLNLDEGGKFTQAEIGRVFGRTRSAIANIKARAVRKIAGRLGA